MELIEQMCEHIFAKFPGRLQKKSSDYYFVISVNPLIELNFPRKIGKWLQDRQYREIELKEFPGKKFNSVFFRRVS